VDEDLVAIVAAAFALGSLLLLAASLVPSSGDVAGILSVLRQ